MISNINGNMQSAEPAAPEQPVLAATNLSVVFPARHGKPPVAAVRDVSLNIGRGETLALVGQSGSGKTTTGRAILQLQKIHSGSVMLLGQELVGMKAANLRRMRRHMQFVLQNPYSSLHPRMTIEQTLSEPLMVHRSVAKTHYRDRVAELLQLVNMDPAIMSRYPHQFSGGQRQRIVIARALAVNPDFIVCDEPVSALDVRTQKQIVELLQSLQEKLGLSYLFITHDLAMVEEIADRVAVMLHGEIIEQGDVASVFGTPAHDYTRTLLDAVPVPDPDIQRQRLRNAAA